MLWKYRELSIVPRNVSFIIENGDKGQIMSFAHFVIVRVVSWCNFYHASTKVQFHKVIHYDRQPSIAERMNSKLLTNNITYNQHQFN